MIFYIIFFLLLLCFEVLYFRIADKYNIKDDTTFRSSHTKAVIRGGGLIFTIALWLWAFQIEGDYYPYMLLAVTLAALVSFIDDIRSLSPLFRLGVQFVSVGLIFYQLFEVGGGTVASGYSLWQIILIAGLFQIVCVGLTNVYNFMDGINGITPAYSFSILVPLAILNQEVCFVDQDLIVMITLSVLVYALYNFRPKDKAKCLAGDVGSVGIALILLFMTCLLICKTEDLSWGLFFAVYAVDGVLTICHRILLHENLLSAHRKHVYQLMANELRIGHLTIALIYMSIQLLISLGLIYLVPHTGMAHWVYSIVVLLVLSTAYIMFMKKYYHLHAEYLTK